MSENLKKEHEEEKAIAIGTKIGLAMASAYRFLASVFGIWFTPLVINGTQKRGQMVSLGWFWVVILMSIFLSKIITQFVAIKLVFNG